MKFYASRNNELSKPDLKYFAKWTVRTGVIGNTLSGVIGYIYESANWGFETRSSAWFNRGRQSRGFEWDAAISPAKTPAGCLSSHRLAMLAACVTTAQLQPPYLRIKSVTYHPGLFVTYHRIKPGVTVLEPKGVMSRLLTK